MLAPVPGYIDAPRDPHPVVRTDVIEESLQRCKSPGPSGEPAMQSDRHHLWPVFTLFVEHVKRIFEVVEKLLPGVESGVVDETVAVFLSVVPFGTLALTVSLIVIVVEAPVASVALLHVTVLLEFVQMKPASLLEAEMKVVPAGRASVTTTF